MECPPPQLKDELLLAGQGSFGKQALAAGALAESCFRGTEIGRVQCLYMICKLRVRRFSIQTKKD